jgi:general secretion pathway protein J
MEQRNKPNVRIEKVVIASRSNVYSTTGFTLVEVMITMTILGFILLIIFGGFRLSFSAWERGDSAKEELQRRRIISQLISQQIKSIVPYRIKTEKAEGDYLAFQGKSQSLKFVSAIPIRTKRPEGFVYAIYEFKEGRLLLYEQRALNRNFFEEEPREETGVSLLEGISNIRFEYYREADKEKNVTEEWVEEWSAKEEKKLPKLLRMTFSFKNHTGGKEEEPSIQLMASIPAHQPEEITAAFPRGIRGVPPGISPRPRY